MSDIVARKLQFVAACGGSAAAAWREVVQRGISLTRCLDGRVWAASLAAMPVVVVFFPLLMAIFGGR